MPNDKDTPTTQETAEMVELGEMIRDEKGKTDSSTVEEAGKGTPKR